MRGLQEFIIAASGTTSNAIQIDGVGSGIAIGFPAAMTGTSVAIHGSLDGINFKPVYIDGTALAITVVNSSVHVINPAKLFGMNSIRLVSNQTELAQRVINVNTVSAL